MKPAANHFFRKLNALRAENPNKGARKRTMITEKLYKHISKYTYDNGNVRYNVNIEINNKTFSRQFYELGNAIKYRDKALKMIAENNQL